MTDISRKDMLLDPRLNWATLSEAERDAAGGTVLRDLFTEGRRGYLGDVRIFGRRGMMPSRV